ncbi:hypothetical protein PG630_10380 [Riemerella anatipestifer]|nr:hypothetical protein [Riemerella anatipestifer]
MKIINTRILNYKPSIFDIKIVKILAMIIFIVIAIIVIPIFLIIDFIKRKFLKKREENIPEFKDNFFFQSENLNLYKNEIEYNNENDRIGEEFLWKIVDYDDELEVFRLETNPKIIGIENEFFTGFKMLIKDKIYLQKIIEKTNNISSILISVNILNKEVEEIEEIGLYALYKFDIDKKKIYGFNKKNKIEFDIDEM